MKDQILLKLSSWLGSRADSADSAVKYVDLTPTDRADIDSGYSDALNYALTNKSIRNIALAGPYGSGKSSVLKTYAAKNPDKYRFLNISLASFKEGDDLKSQASSGAQSQLIERSILQQMLYGADANQLPFSRFKRISTPTRPFLKSMAFVAWCVGAFALFHNKQLLFDPDFSSSTWWLLAAIAVVESAAGAFIVSKLYEASFKVSLKKISLANAEIETSNPSDSSILNRHLDEIIYFFQETDYDVVVIEDLDRFREPEIFVNLREINKLVNDNLRTHGPLKFVYALRDDMFIEGSRAKFFDFIIPIVPVINSYNSLDMMQDRVRSVGFESKIESQFLREVSLFVDDLRLIHNIFNEFVVYYDRLQSDSLDVTKLLAMMVYKNVYPRDFENLHHGRGLLFEICEAKSNFIARARVEVGNRLDDAREELDAIGLETASSVRELIDTYLGRIASEAVTPIYGIVLGEKNVPLNELTDETSFERLLDLTQVEIATHPQYHPQHRRPLGKSFEDIENEVRPDAGYLVRKSRVENAATKKIIAKRTEIRKLEREIAALPNRTLSQLIQGGEVSVHDSVPDISLHEHRLLVYLVDGGYVDENYHLYTSNFYEGRLTRRDRDFLLSIRSNNKPNPNQKIDTPKEVCAHMRESDFHQMYVLNVQLVEYLLANRSQNRKRLAALTSSISANFDDAGEFFTAYFLSGKHTDLLIRQISADWPSFAVRAAESRQASEIVFKILLFVDPEHIVKEMNRDRALTEFISKDSELLASEGEFPRDRYDMLVSLDVRFESLDENELDSAMIEYVYENNLYEISLTNIRYMLERFGAKSLLEDRRLETANYTTVLELGDETIKSYVASNIDLYVDQVFLQIPENASESESTILVLLNSDDLSTKQRESILRSQDHVFERFDGIPSELWTVLLDSGKIRARWQNLVECLEHDDIESESITNFLQQPESLHDIVGQALDNTAIEGDKLRVLTDFILTNDSLSDSIYCGYADWIPYRDLEFPEGVSSAKRSCLARTRTVLLGQASYDSAKSDPELVALLIEESFDEYLQNKEEYPVDDEVLEELFRGKLDQIKKASLVRDLTPHNLNTNSALLSLVAEVLANEDVYFSEFDPGVLASVILGAGKREKSLQILIRAIRVLDKEATMDVLGKMDEPYSEIANYGRRPKLERSELNENLARTLESAGYISSVNVEVDGIRINTHRLQGD